MTGYKYKLVYVVGSTYDVKYGNNARQLKVFAERHMKATSFNLITL